MCNNDIIIITTNNIIIVFNKAISKISIIAIITIIIITVMTIIVTCTHFVNFSSASLHFFKTSHYNNCGQCYHCQQHHRHHHHRHCHNHRRYQPWKVIDPLKRLHGGKELGLDMRPHPAEVVVQGLLIGLPEPVTHEEVLDEMAGTPALFVGQPVLCCCGLTRN